MFDLGIDKDEINYVLKKVRDIDLRVLRTETKTMKICALLEEHDKKLNKILKIIENNESKE